MLNAFLIGCCYYPEHWEKENMKKDLENIRQTTLKIMNIFE